MLVPRSVIKSIGKVAAKDPSRYAINGVQFIREEGGGCRAVATDGRRLVVCTWRDDEVRKDYPAVGKIHPDVPVHDFDIIVPVKTLDLVARAIPKQPKSKPILTEWAVLGEKPISPTGAAKRFGFATTNLEVEQVIRFEPIDGHFPKWRDVIPNGDGWAIPEPEKGEEAPESVDVRIGFSPKLLSETVTAVDRCADLANSERGGVAISLTGPKRPALISGDGCDVEAIGVLMPVNLARN